MNSAALHLAIQNEMGVSELEEHGLSVRIINDLERAGFVTIKDLLYSTEGVLLTKRNIGPTAVKRIKDAIIQIGVTK